MDSVPFLMPISNARCIVIEGVVYVSHYDCIYKLIPGDKWQCLEYYDRRRQYGLGRLGSNLAMVGGLMHNTGNVTGEIIRFDSNNKWSNCGSSMPTPRCDPTVTCTNNYLIAISGKNNNGDLLPIIEILHSTTLQWYRAKPVIPKITLSPRMSALLIDDQHLFVANIDDSKNCTVNDSELMCVHMPLSILLGRKENTPSKSALHVTGKTFKPMDEKTCNENNPKFEWKSTKNATIFSTLALSNKTIFSFISNQVYTFHLSTNSWAHVANLDAQEIPEGTAAAVLEDSILFIGGKIDEKEQKTVKKLVIK